jgi:hypothetical protein
VRELSLHILDIVENGIGAGADFICISIIEDRKTNWLRIQIKDNGRGISKEILDRVTDPFFTTRKVRKVGLGLSLFKEASNRCEGEFHISSHKGKGTEVSATFRRDHIDLAPIGDMGGTLSSLILGNAEVNFVYTHRIDDKHFELDTRRIQDELEDVPIQDPQVLKYISDHIRESLASLE